MVTIVLKPEFKAKKQRLRELSLARDKGEKLSPAELSELKALQPFGTLLEQRDVRPYEVPSFTSKTGAYMLPVEAEGAERVDEARKLAEAVLAEAIEDGRVVSVDAVAQMVSEAVAAHLAEAHKGT